LHDVLLGARPVTLTAMAMSRTPGLGERRSVGERHRFRRARARRRRALLLVALALVCAVVAFTVADVLAVDKHGANVQHFQIHSARVHSTLNEALVVPPGSDGAGRPLLVFLHGKGGNEDSELNSAFFAALARLGPRAPDVLFPNGGDDSYWHDRASGDWAGHVMDEAIPQAVRRVHADGSRIAIGGISMGGFGAYDLARLHPRRFCAVGGDSAALWRSGAETAEGAFDSGEDFARNDVIEAAQNGDGPGPRARLWVDVGTEDPFRSADVELAHLLRADGRQVELHVWQGGHEGAYWTRHLASYLSFYAQALQECKS
jgi:enterochelin esterase-like enzyme